MEQILQKLSEIEITAQRIMEDAGRSKAALSAEMEQQCRNFDAELEQETNRKIQELKDNLEAQKDQELTSLRHRTEQQLDVLQAESPAAGGRLIPTASQILKGVIRYGKTPFLQRNINKDPCHAE